MRPIRSVKIKVNESTNDIKRITRRNDGVLHSTLHNEHVYPR